MTDTAPPPWTFQWKELYDEVITSGLCTGCAGCVIVCPHDVIGYKHEPGAYTPFHIEEELGLADCAHGFGNAKGKGCTECYDSGHKGRMGIHEVLKTDAGLQKLIISSPSRDELTEYLDKRDFHNLFKDGLGRVLERATTIEEVARVTSI